MRAVLKPMINSALVEKPKGSVSQKLYLIYKYINKIGWIYDSMASKLYGDYNSCCKYRKKWTSTFKKRNKTSQKKYEKEEKEIIIVSDNEEKESQEKQDKIDEEIKKRQLKLKQRRPTVSDEAIDLKDLSNYNPQNNSNSSEILKKLNKNVQNYFPQQTIYQKMN